eukprot:6207571-Pleurochrysis_carterae.AAC.5
MGFMADVDSKEAPFCLSSHQSGSGTMYWPLRRAAVPAPRWRSAMRAHTTHMLLGSELSMLTRVIVEEPGSGGLGLRGSPEGNPLPSGWADIIYLI